MSYLSQEIGSNEKIVNLTGISWWLMAPYIFAMLLTTIISIVLATSIENNLFSLVFLTVGVGLAIITSLPKLINKLTTEIAITDQRVISKKGWLQISVISTPLSKVNNINVYQSFLGNIFNYGNVEITTATAEERDNHIICALHNPKIFRNVLSEEIDKQEQTRGMANK